jgi:membrane protein implicated in regulation of membrane protease activity
VSIGGGIFLLVIGAIMAFALDFTVVGIDIQLIGYILLVAGFLVLVLGLVLRFRPRRAETTVTTEIDPATGERIVRRRTDEDETRY